MKLEDIPKNEGFGVPEGYFEQLPGRIQARISAGKVSEPSFFYRYKLQYALPAVLLFAIGIFWVGRMNQPQDAESILASVKTEDIMAYLNNSDLTTDEVINHAGFDDVDAEEIETEVYEQQLNELIDLDNLDLENIQL